MKRVVELLFLLVGILMPMATVEAQDNVSCDISANVVNQYYWRGQQLGEAALQPTLSLSYGAFSLTGLGSVGISQPTDTKEFDLTAAYSVAGFNVGLTDYWFNSPNERYFNYAAHQTSHVFELNVGYDFGPCAFQWYTNVGGNDGVNSDGQRAYSSYMELSAPFSLGGCDWTATVGAVPYATSFYADANGFAVTDVSLKVSKDIKITDSFSIPAFTAVSCNPSTEKAYFLFGITLKP